MRFVLILAAACVALVVVMALTRGGARPHRIEAAAPEAAPSLVQAARPAVAVVAPAKQEEAPAPDRQAMAEQRERQVDDDAAAVGMTTRDDAAEPASAPEERKEP